MPDVVPSAEARTRLPQLIDELLAHPDGAIEIGRQRRREVVMLNASRYDELMKRQDAVRDLAWALFADERIDNPTSGPISWEEAQRRRRR